MTSNDFSFLKKTSPFAENISLKNPSLCHKLTGRQTDIKGQTDRQTDRQVDTQSSFGWKLMGDDNPLRGPDKISPVRGANVKNNLRL